MARGFKHGTYPDSLALQLHQFLPPDVERLHVLLRPLLPLYLLSASRIYAYRKTLTPESAR